MNKIKSYMAMAALLLAGFTSCAVEQDGSSQQNTTSGNGTKVTVKINNGAAAKTRATAGATGTLPGADRENEISELYAVLYKDKNNGYAYYKTFKCTHDTDPSKTNEYTFNVEKAAAGGVYYMYLIANPTTELKTVLDADNSGGEIRTEADLYAFTVTPVLGPETDISQVKDFTMTSPRTQIDMKGDEETVVNGDGTGIVLTRLAVRIDVDASALNNSATDANKKTTFQITKVKMNTRNTQSDLMRGGAHGLAMTGLSTDTNVEFSGFTAVTDFIETDGKYWKGAIYSCENYDTSNPTILTIEGVYKHGESQSLNVSQQVEFRDVVRDGTGAITSQEVIPLQRNHLYKVVLTPKYDLGGLVFDKISYSIQVIDWQSGETLKFAGNENLTKQSTPSFTVSGALSLSGTESDGKTNPTLIYTGVENGSIFLTVTSETTGTMLECPTFNSTKYGLVASETTNDANGNLVETYKIDIDDDVAIATDYTFKISNAINTTLYREFVLKRRPKLPIEYVAKGNIVNTEENTIGSVASGSTKYNGKWKIDTQLLYNSTYFFNWNNANIQFGTGAMCYYENEDPSTYLSYHIPTKAEWVGIVPGIKDNDNDTFYGDASFTQNEVAEINSHTRSFSSTYSSRIRSGSSNWVRYAIRFNDATEGGNNIGSTYRSAFRYYYDYVNQKVDVSVIYLGSSSDPESAIFNESYWTLSEEREIITRTFPACGLASGTKSTFDVWRSSSYGYAVSHYAKESVGDGTNHVVAFFGVNSSTTNLGSLVFCGTNIWGGEGWYDSKESYGRPVRLFLDE